MKIKNIIAFTLAEVLITLGIIGVVAALTIPTLINSYKKQEESVKLKKFYSSMTQAIKLSEIENGSCEDWVKPDRVDDENGLVESTAYSLAMNYFDTYLKPYFKFMKIDYENAKVYFSDGTVAGFSNGDCIDVRFDTNGDKLPNEFGKDVFNFLICNRNSVNKDYYKKPNRCFSGYGEWTREHALADCKTYPVFCSNLLEMDNFEFKDD